MFEGAEDFNNGAINNECAPLVFDMTNVQDVYKMFFGTNMNFNQKLDFISCSYFFCNWNYLV